MKGVWRAGVLAAACVMGISGPLPASGQTMSSAESDAGVERPRIAASPLLPRNHWALGAVRRAEAMGLIPGWPVAQRLVPREAVRAMLIAAARAAGTGDPATRALTREWLERFAGEFGDDPAAGGPRLTTALAAAFVAERGLAAPGTGEFPPTRTGAQPLDDRTGLEGNAVAALLSGDRFSISASAYGAPGRDEAARFSWEAAVGLGRWRLSAGRQGVGYGWGRSGGVMLTGDAPFDRVEFMSREPVRVPIVSRLLGPGAFDLFLGRLDSDRHPDHPLFWGARVAFQPHPRLDVALERAAMFGAEGGDWPITFSTVAKMVIGSVADVGFENQELSGSVRWRMPTERLVPLTAYIESGAEDAAGAWRDVPGYITGLYVPMVPGAPALAVGGEFIFFNERCCGNPPWYRHHAFEGAWALGKRPLGSPLGGSGHELRLYSDAEPAGGSVRVTAEVFRRLRTADNLYVPGREGWSQGLAGRLAWRVTPRWELSLNGGIEDGEGWNQETLALEGRKFWSGW